ncbi:MAG: hypothetical protein IT555_10140 [Acetobacteraceae bacterium]|nr:hypothetical protein [Acetobacteraceae bacterium]
MSDPRPTRRGLLALAPAAALVPAGAAVAAPHPDAELLAAVARFRATHDAQAAIYNDPDETIDDDARDAAWNVHEPEHHAALDALCAARATTLEGIVARGVMLAEYAPDWLDPEWSGEYVDDRQLMSLLRDLVAMGEPRNP